MLAPTPSRISGSAPSDIEASAGPIGRRTVSFTITTLAISAPAPRALSTSPQPSAPIVSWAITGPRICQTPLLRALKTANADVTAQIHDCELK
ncbi:hypothetical protein SPURM210S_07260 [Streptomyces purpurascens]